MAHKIPGGPLRVTRKELRRLRSAPTVIQGILSAPTRLSGTTKKIADAVAAKALALLEAEKAARRIRGAALHKAAIEGNAGTRKVKRQGVLDENRPKRHPHVGSEEDEALRATALHMKAEHARGYDTIAVLLERDRNVVRRWLRGGGVPDRSRGEQCPLCKWPVI